MTWPLGKLEPPSGAATTRRYSPARGRGRFMISLSTVETSPVPQARAANPASTGNRSAKRLAMIAGGTTRLCGGNPSHEAAAMTRSRNGLRRPWTLSDIARSNASLRRARTAPKIPRNPNRPRMPTTVAVRPRSSATGVGRVSLWAACAAASVARSIAGAAVIPAVSVDRHGPRTGRPARTAGSPVANSGRGGATRGTLCDLPRTRNEGKDAAQRPGGAPPGQLDRRQGIDDQEAREARPRGGQAGRPGDALPGALLRPLLLPGPGPAVLQLHRAHPRRTHDQADAGPREADRHGPRRADVRGGRQGVRHLLQHRRGDRR